MGLVEKFPFSGCSFAKTHSRAGTCIEHIGIFLAIKRRRVFDMDDKEVHDDVHVEVDDQYGNSI